MKLKTHLISGAGNTFHITYSEAQSFSSNRWNLPKMKDVVREVCAKNKADGFIFLENFFVEESEQYKWYFFNNDGSNAEMCGNATRCVGYYIKNILESKKNFWNLLTVAGPIRIDFVDIEKYKITMTPVKELKSDQGFYCDTGVPHLVIEKSEIHADEALISTSKKIREHSEFSPRGTNVTYVVFGPERNKVQAVSYERGVENFTAACGTGAMAAALFNLIKRGVRQTQVEMPGGTLNMDLSDLNRPTMTGPAVLLGSYEYEVSI